MDIISMVGIRQRGWELLCVNVEQSAEKWAPVLEVQYLALECFCL